MAKPRTYPVRVKSVSEKLSIVDGWYSTVATSERNVELFRTRGGPAPMSVATEASLLALVEENRERLRRAEAEFGTREVLEAQYNAAHASVATEG